jgi:hypothetical protein
MVKVLRVETLDGIGMYLYAANDGCSYMYEMTEIKNHPCPYEDAALAPIWKHLDDSRSWNFGFIDLAQLRNWIYRQSWRDELSNTMKISIYEVDAKDFHTGDTQCIFKKHNATLIERFGFDEIYTKEI